MSILDPLLLPQHRFPTWRITGSKDINIFQALKIYWQIAFPEKLCQL